MAFAREPDWERWPGAEAVEAWLDAEGLALGTGLGLGPFHGCLPEPEQLAVVSHAVNADGLRAWLSGSPPELRMLPAVAEQAAGWRGPGVVKPGG